MQKTNFVARAIAVAALLTLTGIGQATPQGLSHPTPHLRAVNYRDLEKYGCGYVTTYDKDRVKYIAVKMILVYKDGSQSTDYIPQVFHTNEKAYGQCGAWMDNVQRTLDLGR